ncbi:formyl transferase [Novosphingopyxis sp. YJ-S2-01]|uniref:formyl transferase n=1 Tax=Novosphingopyxis sp. YJ-S2-01 TaxID=2794021 RepID=UPI0018DC7751|nr:hypothetical protein [Novosphingopyxis sp. YJ-S2-01]
MSLVAITGDHPRHHYFVKKLHQEGILTGWVREGREAFVPDAPQDIPKATRDLFVKHFKNRQIAEERFFGRPIAPDVSRLDTTPDNLNNRETVDFLKRISPRLVLSYGCHKIENALLDLPNLTFWNTHGGLSPSYRGVITHFWPSYNCEPQMTGLTLHETTSALDGGAIIHQSGAVLERGDGIHDLAARTVKAYCDELAPLIRDALNADCLPTGVTQKSSGRLWLSSHWRPEHLHLVYDTFHDRIVDKILDGSLSGRTPKLVSVLKKTFNPAVA